LAPDLDPTASFSLFVPLFYNYILTAEVMERRIWIDKGIELGEKRNEAAVVYLSFRLQGNVTES
jgi:hypothetical protein